MTYSIDIPEFYYDAFARIIPGLAIIIAYVPPWKADVQSFTIFDGILIIVEAYLIGITADNALNPLEAVIGKYFNLLPVGEALKCCGSDLSMASHITKSVAETIMFRSCAALSLALFFKRAALFDGFGEHEYKFFALGLLTLFFYCYIMRLVHINKTYCKARDVMHLH